MTQHGWATTRRRSAAAGLDRAVGPAVVIVLAALALAPVLLARGFVLIGDMSFVPDQPWKSTWLGLDGSVPRAVPADAVVSALSVLVPGDLLQKVVLLGALVVAGLGMHRLVAGLLAQAGRTAPLGAAVLYLWNPWVLERLAIGHWGLLLGYAALPWVARAALAYRRDPDLARLAAVVVPLALASFASPTGGLLSALVVGALAFDRTAIRPAAVLVGTVVALNLPWLLPGLLGAAEPTDVAGVSAFAARSDTPYGVVGSVLSLGGIWKESVVPDDRASVLLVGLAVLLTVTGLALLVTSARRDRTGESPRFLVLAAIGLVLALLPTFGAGEDLVGWLVGHVPGAGILRDSQKWLALVALGAAVGFGRAVDAAGRHQRRAGLPVGWLVVVLALLPVALLPSFAWGIGGKLEPVRYPAEWTQVRDLLEDQPAGSRRTVVLPFSAYQAFAWNDGRAALDPAIRFLPGDVLTNDTLTLDDTTAVAGEDPAAGRVARTIAADEPLVPVLRSVGVRYVLVERSAAGGAAVVDTELVAAGRVLHDGPELRLIDLGTGSVPATRDHAAGIVAGDVLAFGLFVVSAVFLPLRQIGGKRDKKR